MLQRDVRQVEGLRVMQTFLDDRAVELRGWDRGPVRKALDDVTEQLWALAVRQDEKAMGARGERVNETVLANQLRYRYFLTLISVAATDPLRDTPLRHVKFPQRRTNTTALVNLARATITAAAPYERKLEAAIWKDFLVDFAAAADKLQKSTAAKFSGRSASVGATANIAALIKHARDVVGMVDAMVRARLKEDDRLLPEWRAVVRRYRAAGR